MAGRSSGGFEWVQPIVWAAVALAVPVVHGCASGADEIEISGRLVAGFASEGVRRGVSPSGNAVERGSVRASCDRKVTSLDSGWALPGYGVRCAVLSEAGAAGGGIADPDGRFTLYLAESHVPAGCMVLDLSGARVADLFFQRDTRGPDGHLLMSGTARLDGATNLGDVWVDEYTGVALASLGPSGAASASAYWDSSGTWMFTGCLGNHDDKPCSEAEESVYTSFTAEIPSFHLVRVSGTDIQTNRPRFLADIRASRDELASCGGTSALTPSSARERYGIEIAESSREAGCSDAGPTFLRTDYLPEMLYSDPETWSVGVFKIEEAPQPDAGGRTRSCDIAFDMQMNVSRRANDLALVGLILSVHISPTTTDYEWCRTNLKQIPASPYSLARSLRLRAQARPVP
ncbi:MAG: hypothetical protein HYY13_01500 [Nitrospirae bacterium]|nr:hypothetical protein [Nitrospirota bacterium]